MPGHGPSVLGSTGSTGGVGGDWAPGHFGGGKVGCGRTWRKLPKRVGDSTEVSVELPPAPLVIPRPMSGRSPLWGGGITRTVSAPGCSVGNLAANLKHQMSPEPPPPPPPPTRCSMDSPSSANEL